MLVSKPHRRTFYEAMMREGVLVAKKDYNSPKHHELDMPNLEVIKLAQSLTSKGYLKTQFSWNWTDEGIDHLREWLHLPSEIVPNTHKKAARAARPAVPPPSSGAYRAPRGGDASEYRRRGDDAKKESAAGGDFRPRFSSGIGRGAGAAPSG